MKLFRRRSKGEETPPRKRSVRRRVGSAIIFALTVLTPVLLASGTVLSQLRAYSDEVDRRVNGVTAQMVAATGAHDALSRLALDLSPVDVDADEPRAQCPRLGHELVRRAPQAVADPPDNSCSHSLHTKHRYMSYTSVHADLVDAGAVAPPLARPRADRGRGGFSG